MASSSSIPALEEMLVWYDENHQTPPPDPFEAIEKDVKRACFSGDLELVENIILRNEEYKQRLLGCGLWCAIDGTKIDVLAYLFDIGAPLYVSQENSAIQRGRLSLLEKMYGYGWRSEASNIIAAIECQDDEVLLWLANHSGQPISSDDLHTAARMGTPRQVDILLAAGARLSDSDALHRAAEAGRRYPGRLEMMKYLVQKGCDVNAFDTQPEGLSVQTSFGRGRWTRGSPLSYACRVGFMKGARWLLEHGADEYLKKHGKRSTMLHANRECKPAVLEEVDALLDEYLCASQTWA